jgi:hypothetical protein
MHKSAPPILSPDHQLAHIAAILARGVVRHARSRRHDESLVPEKLSDSSQDGLEVGEKSRLSGSRRHGI